MLAVVILLASCYEDKGNYDFETIGNTVISGFGQKMTKERGKILEIIPTINFQGDPLLDRERYDFTWEAITEKPGENGQFMRTVRSKDRNLYYLIELPPEEYQLVLTVYDKQTEISWKQNVQLIITGEIGEGWQYLTERIDESGERYGDMSIYVYDATTGVFTLLNSILEFSGFPYLKNPVQVCNMTSLNIESVTYIATEEETGWLDDYTFTWKSDQMIRYLMLESVPSDFTFHRTYYLKSI